MYEIYEKLLEEFGVSTADVSRATGIGKSTFSAWKNGEYVPKQDKRQKIANFFGVSLDYLDGKTDVRARVAFNDKELTQRIQKYIKKVYGVDPPEPRDKEQLKRMQQFEAELLYGDGTEDNGKGYYLEPGVAEIAKKLYERQDLRVLFDATKDLSEEDINFVTRMLEGLKDNDE